MFRFLFSFLLFSSIPANIPNEIMHELSTVESEMTFRNIHIDGNQGSYIVTGETKINNRETFYSVEDGHIEFIHDRRLILKDLSPNWSSFKIIVKIPSAKLPHNGTLLLNFYERTSKGEIIHSYPVILGKFLQ